MTVTLADVAAQYRTGLYNAAVTAIDDATVQTVLGHPGPQQLDDIVSVGHVGGQFVDPETGTATISATGRTRELQLSCAVTFSIFRRGGIEVEETVTARAFALFSAVEKQVRVDDITLGGVVRWCMCTGWPEPAPEQVEVNKAKGRVVEFPALFVARTRLTNI